jgi:hypothetical protein
VSDPLQGRAFVSTLPHGLASGRVVIQHSPPTQTSGFESFASYDAVETRQMGRLRHWDVVTGAELFLSNERPGPAQVSKRHKR